jgi:hypothetical protein
MGTVSGVPSDRYDNLAPGAVVAALRSFPRRYDAAFRADPMRGVDETAVLRTRDGRTVRQVVADTTETISVLTRAVQQVLHPGHDVVLPAVVTGEELTGADASAKSVAGWVDELSAAAQTIATRIADAPPADLLRSAKTGAGDEVSALDVARQAVRVGAENLRVIEHTVGKSAGDDDD